MKRTGFATVLVALLVVLAGCAGGAGTLTDSPKSNDATATASSGSAATGETGTVNFYVSDEENAIENFEHLNVTIERVTFTRADSGDDSVDAEDESENDSAEESAEVDGEENVSADANATVTANATATIDNESEVEAAADDDADADAIADAEEKSEDDSESDAGGQVTYEVENVTVDLTELKGDNASLVDAYDVPKGDYNAVHVEVSNVTGTLKSGEQVNIKLPSNKLKLNSEFTIEKGGSTDFVFDITAFEAGQSGKYILKPVISESGTNVPIKKVGEDVEDDEDDKNADESEDKEQKSEDAEEEANAEAETELEANDTAELNVSVDGNITAGENVTLTVTQNGTAVENATVTVNDEEVGTTDADGTLVVELPDVKEVDLKVTHGDAEAEYEFDLVAVVVTETGGNDSKKPDSPGKSDNDDA